MSSLQTAFADAQSKIGTEVGVANWITVDQKMIDDFAKTTFDEQWIHVDPERAAKETPFGGAIAHDWASRSEESQRQPRRVVQRHQGPRAALRLAQESRR